MLRSRDAVMVFTTPPNSLWPGLTEGSRVTASAGGRILLVSIFTRSVGSPKWLGVTRSQEREVASEDGASLKGWGKTRKGGGANRWEGKD